MLTGWPGLVVVESDHGHVAGSYPLSTVDVNGVKTWYTESGKGAPLVLLHGGMSDGSTWGTLTDLLAESFHVFVPDRRGHGRTPDTDAPFSYAAMAVETAAFCDAVIGEPAHLVGWSDGGITALLVSIAGPTVINRQVLIGTNFHHDGVNPEQLGLGESPDDPDAAFMRSLYEAISASGPDHWPTFWTKTRRLWETEPTLSTDDLAAVTVPTLVIVGDDEPISLGHTVELYESISPSQLCVIPGASHLAPLEQPDVVGAAIARFLTMDLPPVTLDPIRRADY